MAKKKSPIVQPTSKTYGSGIPYVSQWDQDADGKVYGVIKAIVLMIAGWLDRKVILPEHPEFPGLPGPDILRGYFQDLGIETTLQHPATCISCRPGDICMIDYGQFPREMIQDVNFKNWNWCIYLGMDTENVYIHDPNWDGNFLSYGCIMAVPLNIWQDVFLPHNRGLSCVRVNIPGSYDPLYEVPPPEPIASTRLSSVDA